MIREVGKLERGTLVRAAKDLDPQGANAKKGMLGVIFERAEWHEPLSGPMVRWTNNGVCNVYDGQIEVVVGRLENL